ncbi:MAG TPA: metal-dependent transcriptional regulator [Candidatus Dormibacteraeota bacterium]
MPKTAGREKASLRSSLSPAQQDYVKALYQLRREGCTVTTSELSEGLGVSAASAVQMLAKLTAMGLATHDRYHGAGLTRSGEAVALEMIRHHRLIEMYLAEALGYNWDEVHEEAERLEHHISERMEERIFHLLGRPAIDPHGDPIPTRGGELRGQRYRPLSESRAGERLVVRRVSDREPDKLRELARLGLTLGTEVEIVGESRFEGPVSIRVAGRPRSLRVPLGIARIVFLEAAA